MPLTLKSFQREDLARAAMHDGCILSWEQGLGKTIAAIAWPLIKGARRVLIVAPGGLHQQVKETALRFFNIHLTTLKSTDQLRPFHLHRPHPSTAAPRFFITTYQDLGQNNADEWPEAATSPKSLRSPQSLPSLSARQKARLHQLTRFLNLPQPPADPTLYFQNIGREQRGIRCVWRPTMARVLDMLDCFDCVVVDEGTRLQADESNIANGVRTLRPKYRLVLTGTPIKNRLESFFWLAWWVCGGSPTPTARWPYPGTADARSEFADQHLEHDRFLTREEEALAAARARGDRNAARRRIQKRSARICNIHRLWKLIAPILIRRRKDECGEDIVPKTIKPIYLQPGYAQQQVYAHHLQNPPVASRARPDEQINPRLRLGMQLNILRQVALAPHTLELGEVLNGVSGPKRSWTDFNPKIAACLSLTADLLDQGEQVLIGSPFRAFNHALHARLTEAGVSCLLLDGDTTPERRGELAARFKNKEYAVMLAGITAMGEGHSFECCSHLILPSLSWAYDENEQFLHRVWRINSPRPVTIYTMILRNTVDELVAQLFGEKGDSAQLALDGRLIEDQVEEIDTATLLAKAVTSFDPTAPTVDEQSIEDQWPTLRQRLAFSEQRYREFHPPITGTAVTPTDLAESLHALNLPSPSALTLELQRKQNREGTHAPLDWQAKLRAAKKWRT